MNYKHLFTPVKIGSCEIPTRIAVTAMVCSMCTEEGDATERYLKYHEAKARGGYGLIITEDYRVNANAGGYKYVAGIYKESQIEGHRKVVEAVHKYGTKIFCQIYHAGRQASAAVNGGVQIVAPSPTSRPTGTRHSSSNSAAAPWTTPAWSRSSCATSFCWKSWASTP